jgi:hypothetical protein
MSPVHTSLLPVLLLLLLSGVLLLLYAVSWPAPARPRHHCPCVLLHTRHGDKLHSTHLADRHCDSNVLVESDRHGHSHGLHGALQGALHLHSSTLRCRGSSKPDCCRCCCTLLPLQPVLLLLELLQLLL